VNETQPKFSGTGGTMRTVPISFPPEMLAEIDKGAQSAKISRSAYLRILAGQALEQISSGPRAA